jgi:hypothetical protein
MFSAGCGELPSRKPTAFRTAKVLNQESFIFNFMWPDAASRGTIPATAAVSPLSVWPWQLGNWEVSVSFHIWRWQIHGFDLWTMRSVAFRLQFGQSSCWCTGDVIKLLKTKNLLMLCVCVCVCVCMCVRERENACLCMCVWNISALNGPIVIILGIIWFFENLYRNFKLHQNQTTLYLNTHVLLWSYFAELGPGVA